MSATLTIRREGDDWFVEDGAARVHITKPDIGIIAKSVADWEEITSILINAMPRSGLDPTHRP